VQLFGLCNIQAIPTTALWIENGGIVYRLIYEGTAGETPWAFAHLEAANYGDTVPVEQTGQDSAGAQGSFSAASYGDISNVEQIATDSAGARGGYASADWLYTLVDHVGTPTETASSQGGYASADWLYTLVDRPGQSDQAAAQGDFVSANHN
jgi:hypothetical protein